MIYDSVHSLQHWRATGERQRLEPLLGKVSQSLRDAAHKTPILKLIPILVPVIPLL